MNEIGYKTPLDLITVTTVIGTFLGLLMTIFLLYNKSVKNSANIFLGLLTLSITLILLPGTIYRMGLLPTFPHFVHLHMMSLVLMGPLAYMYVRACTQKGFVLKGKLWLHFLTSFIALLYHLPFYLQSGDLKVVALTQFLAVGKFGGPRIVVALKIVQSTIYFIICILLVLQYRKSLSNTASYIDEAFHRWLLVFCILLLMPMLNVVFFFALYNASLASIFTSCFFLFILAILLAALIKPELFHTFPHQMLLPESSEEQKQKYESSNLQTTQKDKYLAKIVTFVERKKPYKAPELTLAELADNVNIPTHYVSQVINEKLGVNFLDFINGYRVKAAQEMLRDANWSHYTIISIAYEAGFNSKSTFYSVFKKYAGMTPSAYRKQTKAVA